MSSNISNEPTASQPKSKDHHYNPTLWTPTMLVLLSQDLPSPFVLLSQAEINCAATIDGNVTLLLTPRPPPPTPPKAISLSNLDFYCILLCIYIFNLHFCFSLSLTRLVGLGGERLLLKCSHERSGRGKPWERKGGNLLIIQAWHPPANPKIFAPAASE